MGNSRNIRFRAWDKTNNEWYMGGDAFDLIFSGSYGDFFFDNDHPCNMRDVDLEWLQYTGLKDKNGKEIYEGDYLRFMNNELQKVVWCTFDAMFQLEPGRCGDPLYCSNSIFIHEEAEIIGNIYENPGLG